MPGTGRRIQCEDPYGHPPGTCPGKDLHRHQYDGRIAPVSQRRKEEGVVK